MNVVSNMVIFYGSNPFLPPWQGAPHGFSGQIFVQNGVCSL